MTTDERPAATALERAPTYKVPALRFALFENEEGVRDGVDLRVLVCANPDCTCTELTLKGHAYAAAPGHEPVARELQFSLVHDVATQKTTGFPRGSSAEEAGLIDALKKVLRRKASKEALRRIFDEQRAEIEPKADPSYDFSAHHDGTLAAYFEVFKTADMPVITIGGVRHFLDDAWCVRPGCTCVDGVLTLCTEIDGAASDDWEVAQVAGVGAIRLPSGTPVPSARPLSQAMRDAVLQPDVLRIMERHRERLRAEAAARWGVERPRLRPAANPTRPLDLRPTLAATAPTPFSKVGRNERCPCGSGKKFKHCCLRSG